MEKILEYLDFVIRSKYFLAFLIYYIYYKIITTDKIFNSIIDKGVLLISYYSDLLKEARNINPIILYFINSRVNSFINKKIKKELLNIFYLFYIHLSSLITTIIYSLILGIANPILVFIFKISMLINPNQKHLLFKFETDKKVGVFAIIHKLITLIISLIGGIFVNIGVVFLIFYPKKTIEKKINKLKNKTENSEDKNSDIELSNKIQNMISSYVENSFDYDDDFEPIDE